MTTSNNPLDDAAEALVSLIKDVVLKADDFNNSAVQQHELSSKLVDSLKKTFEATSKTSNDNFDAKMETVSQHLVNINNEIVEIAKVLRCAMSTPVQKYQSVGDLNVSRNVSLCTESIQSIKGSVGNTNGKNATLNKRIDQSEYKQDNPPLPLLYHLTHELFANTAHNVDQENESISTRATDLVLRFDDLSETRRDDIAHEEDMSVDTVECAELEEQCHPVLEVLARCHGENQKNMNKEEIEMTQKEQILGGVERKKNSMTLSDKVEQDDSDYRIVPHELFCVEEPDERSEGIGLLNWDISFLNMVGADELATHRLRSEELGMDISYAKDLGPNNLPAAMTSKY